MCLFSSERCAARVARARFVGAARKCVRERERWFAALRRRSSSCSTWFLARARCCEMHSLRTSDVRVTSPRKCCHMSDVRCERVRSSRIACQYITRVYVMLCRYTRVLMHRIMEMATVKKTRGNRDLSVTQFAVHQRDACTCRVH